MTSIEDVDRSAGPSRAPAFDGEHLDSRVVPFWLVSGVLGTLVLCGLIGGGLAIFFDDLPGDGIGVLIVASVVAALSLAWSLISPALAWRRWRFRVDAELLLARYGIIFHEEKAIPISRLQHVDLTRGPIERMFGLATLVVFTAGTESASFRLPGLAVERARELRDLILEARGDDLL